MPFLRTLVLACSASCWYAPAVLAQQAGYQVVDSRSLCTAAPIAQTLPTLGTTMTILVPQGFTGSHRGVSILMTGASNTWLGGSPLPIDMNFQFMIDRLYVYSCGWLLNSAELAQSAGYGASVTFAIPNAPGLAGVTFFQQVVFQVTGGSYSGFGSHSLAFGPLARGTIGY